MNSPEILGLPEQLDRFAIDGKPAFLKMLQDFVCMVNALGMCEFSGFALGAENYAELLSTATGIDYDVDRFMQAGERLFNLKRLINVKMGISRKDDTLPERLLKTMMPEGPAVGNVAETEKMIDEYYALRGWNNDGVPTDEKLSELNLK
jgi:aldehyde:ferredoxin oxidoreductase